MPTNEERREVAARLRNLASHKASDEELTLDALGLYRGENIEGYDTYGVMHLADLIEPEPERTCKNITGGDVPFHCSECDCVTLYDEVRETGIMAEMGMLDAPNYCPNCGLRIRRDDE